MPPGVRYHLGDALEEFATVQRCDLQQIRISPAGKILYNEKPLVADLFLWRIIEEYWQSAFHILSVAERLGSRTINSSKSIALCADKALTAITLQEAGVPAASATIVPRDGWAKPENGEIIKPLDEGGGSGVRRISRTEQVRAPHLQQEYLGDDLSFARVIFINNKILGFHKRKAMPGSLANNFDLGGEIVSWEAPKEALLIAEQAHETSGTFFSAVDLVEHEGDWQVMEINSTPGYRGLVEIHGHDIHRRVAKEIASIL